jgi:hypothetical protein
VGQTDRGSLTGRVTDPNGAAVANAKVTATKAFGTSDCTQDAVIMAANNRESLEGSDRGVPSNVQDGVA